jgi:ribosome-associated protein
VPPGPTAATVHPSGVKNRRASSTRSSRDTRATSETDYELLMTNLGGKLTTEGALIVTSTKTRDQIKNRDDAMSKLALIVRSALERPKKRFATKPTRASKRRRVDDKRHRSQIKRDRRGDD